MRRLSLAVVGIALALLASGQAGAAGAAGSAGTAPPPNVVFILADDLGWGDLGVYGHPLLRTPHLDRLAREGARFTQFYVASPVCSPSRAAFMTGRFPAHLGIHSVVGSKHANEERGISALRPETPNLAALLKRAGYRTAHFGKWHLGLPKTAKATPGGPLASFGFDESRLLDGWPRDLTLPEERHHSSEQIIDEVIRFIERRDERPFFVQAWLLDVHSTLHPTAEQMAPYRHLAPTGVPYRGAMQIYYGSVTELDRQVGRLLDRLDTLGLAGNTLVIFSSDNGPEVILAKEAAHSGVGSTGKLRGRKTSLYEGGIRMPFIVRWPDRVRAGRRDGGSVIAAVDLLPTLLALAGAPPPEELALDGEDVSPVLLAGRRERTKPLFWEYRFPMRGHVIHRSPTLAMRSGRWKLLMDADRERIELYDVIADPSELENLARGHPEVVERLAAALAAWHAEVSPAVPAEDPQVRRR